MCVISIESDDEIYDAIMDWMRDQSRVRNALSLMARTTGSQTNPVGEENVHIPTVIDPSTANISHWSAKITIIYEPSLGTYWLYHNRHYLRISRELNPQATGLEGVTPVKNKERLNLSCFGRSSTPIKQLIQTCSRTYLEKLSTSTVIRRPAPKELRAQGRYPWMKVSTRPSRSIATVILDAVRKQQVLDDIAEYLSPSAARWYADRGIPYRRGYLFYGPPGTGKTSMSFAIAGAFGLDIYCISLLEPSITEESLSLLFNALPSRCVVLLEDIDSAGLQNRGIESLTDAEDHETVTVEPNRIFSHSRSNVSLSGLLNAIDGVATQEGRVLILTTNLPEKLDAALTRPGRVDMKVNFPLADSQQIRELFVRMYQLPSSMGVASQSEKDSLESGKNLKNKELNQIAKQFSERLAGRKLSPAQVQGFLLKRKNDPRKALEDVGEL